MLLVFGSINVDAVVSAPRLPERGETVLGASCNLAPGGKGANQAVAAARYGAEVCLVAAVGKDAHGELARRELDAAGVATGAVRAVDLPTGYASVWVERGGENRILVASGANQSLRAAHAPLERLGADTTVLLQLEVPAEESEALAREARSRGARVVLNAAPFIPLSRAWLELLDILVVNQVEARDLAAALRSGRPGADVLEPLRSLARDAGLTAVVTRGRRGALAFVPGGATHEVPALDIAPVDTTGAGDAYVGVLAAALDEGRAPAEALRAASAAAGLACTRIGAQAGMADREAIEAAARRLPEAAG